MAELFIKTRTSLNIIFPHQVFCGIILGNAFFDMGKVDHSETRMPDIDLSQESVNLMSGNWSATQEMHQLGAELKARLY